MADKWPLANGNWSTAANWNGGTLPADGDIIYLDNRTVTLDQNIDLPNADLRTTQRSGGTAGGNLTWSSGTYRIRLREIRAGSSIVITTGGTSGVTFGSGTVFQGSDTTNIRAVSIGGSSPVTFESGCQAKNGVGGAVAEGITFATVCTVTGFLDAICQASVGTAAAVTFSNAASINITGAIQHGFAGTTITFSAALGTWTITSETCVGATTTNGAKINVGSAGLILIRQSPTVFLFPTTWTTQHISMNATSAQSFEYRGDIEQPTGAASQWTNSSANGTFRHRGTIYGSNPLNTSQMLTATAGGSKFVLDRLAPNSVSGRMPALGAGWCLRSDSQIISPTESTNVTLVPSTSVGDPPAVSNVRSGTIYHFATLTGTCAVPGAGSVAAGVPVDATVGTAVLTQSQVQIGCNAALAAYETHGVASADDLASVGVDLTPVLEKLPESGRASTQASVDAIAVGLSGSAPVEPTGDSETVMARLTRIEAATGSILGGKVLRSAGPVTPAGDISLVVGSDYVEEIDGSLLRTFSDPGASIHAKLTAGALSQLVFSAAEKPSDPATKRIAGTITEVSEADGVTSVRIEILRTAIPVGPYSSDWKFHIWREADDLVSPPLLEGCLTLEWRA